ncbi:MAG TPA: YtpI family protein [Virgibacillus sp.]|nr:YtpI family protein [Virgibacillus sp.]
MLIFALIIVISVVLYIYYKVAILKSTDRLTQEYFNAKSRLCLGSFIIAFGINQYILYQTRLTLFIGIIFIILGGLQLNVGFKEARHYRKEWRRLNP